MAQQNQREDRSGLIAALAAFALWGVIPAYWKLLKFLPASEILAHRFVWTTLFLIALLSWQRRWPEIRQIIRSPRALTYCLTSGIAISINWLTFIWAVNANRIVETSLGYFMTPLVNILFGAVFLRERPTRIQLTAISLALIGVLVLTFGYGRFPWVAIILCVSFGLYGLLRKKSGTRPIAGLFIETILLVPLAAGFLVALHHSEWLIFPRIDLGYALLLCSTGVVTALPLVWFGHAARHLRLTTLGFLQYLAPSGSFLIGVFVYHEPFTGGQLITFVLIWIGLAMFSAEAAYRWRTRAIETAAAAVAESPA
ncbi:MAG: EamA family transporter RarD [Chthoniobacterales bacterium]